MNERQTYTIYEMQERKEDTYYNTLCISASSYGLLEYQAQRHNDTTPYDNRIHLTYITSIKLTENEYKKIHDLLYYLSDVITLKENKINNLEDTIYYYEKAIQKLNEKAER